MIKKLRWRVVGFTVLSVALVLFLLMGMINVANYIRVDRSVDEMLNFLAENGGDFPRHGDRDKNEEKPDESKHRHVDMNPETPYETRFFTVTLASDRTVRTINTGKIAAVSSEQAVQMVSKAQETGKSTGYDGNYKYLKTQSGEDVLYIFVDCNRDITSARSFLQISFLIALGGLIAISLLVILLSPRMIRPIAESYSKQKEFITNAGHELKTPMAVIESCTEVIEMQSGETKWTSGIREQVKKLTSLTSRLVALAKMDEGPTNLIMTELETNIEGGITLHGNQESLSELISILADNAIKYGDPNEPISFSLTRQGKKILMIQENSAKGLKAGNYDQLFDRFYRGDTSHSSSIPGSGIGLSMAQAIVSAHGGTISAHSPDAKHLRFTIKL